MLRPYLRGVCYEGAKQNHRSSHRSSSGSGNRNDHCDPLSDQCGSSQRKYYADRVQFPTHVFPYLIHRLTYTPPLLGKRKDWILLRRAGFHLIDLVIFPSSGDQRQNLRRTGHHVCQGNTDKGVQEISSRRNPRLRRVACAMFLAYGNVQ